MADYTPRQGSGIIDALRSRYRDMLDGTHALVVAAEALFNGVQPQMDDTDKLAVSLYYEAAGAPGDTNVSAIAPLPVTTAAASQPAAATNSDEPAVNTAAVVTLAAAGLGVSNVLGLVAWSYDLLTEAGTLIIEDGAGTTVFKVDIPESGPGFIPFNPALLGTANTAMIITLAAGGAGVSGIVNVHAWTQG
jgi:hypothetical protein